MSMEIRETYNRTQTDYAERKKTQQALREEKAKEAQEAKEEKEKASKQADAPKDEYISSEQSGAKPSGLYRLEQDENGNKKIVFEDPKKAKKKERAEEAAEQCTTDTGNVDREIEKQQNPKKKTSPK